MKKLLLLKVPYSPHPKTTKSIDFRGTSSFRPVPSLALASLAGFVKRYAADWEVEAVDINTEGYEEPGMPIRTDDFSSCMEHWIKWTDYDVLGISAMFAYNERWVADAMRLSERYHPNAKTFVGGGYPTMFMKECHDKFLPTASVSGEGEVPLLSLLGIDTSFFGLETGFDLAYLSVPDWKALDVATYFRRSGSQSLPIEVSRGCPYNCSYCTVTKVWGAKIRYKPVENVINEIKAARDLGATSVHFVDDNLTFDKEWAMNLFHRLLLVPHAPTITASNFSVKHLDPMIIDALIGCGLKTFNVAVETGCPEMQKKINKRLDFDQVRHVVQMLKDRDVHVHLCWMLGFPGETRKQLDMTFALARELRAHSNQFLTVLPYPGTKLYEDAKRDGLLNFDGNLDNFDCRGGDYVRSDEWTHEQLQGMIYDANIEINFINNPRLDDPAGRKVFKAYLLGLVKRLPEHVIAHLLLADLGVEEHRKIAEDLMKREDLKLIFQKYVDQMKGER